MLAGPRVRRYGFVALALLVCAGRALGEGDCPPGGQALKARLATLRTLSANFEQRVTAADGHDLQTSAGLMQLAKPGHIYWVAEPPFEQTVVADGTRIWIYDPDLAQVTVKTLHRQLDNSPAALLVGDSDKLLAEFRVCVVPDAGGPEAQKPDANRLRIVLRPLATDAVYTRIELVFAGTEPRAIIMTDSLGQRTDIQLRDVELNQPVDPKLFRFMPPPGVDVFQDD
ncbi:MAG: outer membrane lipoprotein chaperone LolA [Gammaproteobacteria bacterium]|nr:outer membrane lipoprotein chaperone LolA [Gammaproteobacteria bacterium]